MSILDEKELLIVAYEKNLVKKFKLDKRKLLDLSEWT